jgi:type I restriction enzyme M protein
MLDTKTKKDIDELRDILVGKVTDPKSQVEHITTGLMYKFMGDLDTKSIQMGGKASFFVGDMETYHWKNFFDSKLSGVDRVEKYENGLKSISQSPSFPTLFREIFKEANLPFKEPATLKKFLSKFNDFEYDNTEVLGNAYEYLLSFMQSQGDAGQFRTPRNIIEFMVQVINPKKDESILDPACGTGGFLLKSFEHIRQSNTKSRIGDLLSANDLIKISDNLVGYDIDPEMTRLALVNMYLNQIKSPRIDEYDSISNDDKWNEFSDIILANPPFFNPKKIGITPHSRFRLNTRKAALLFVDYIIQHLKPNGRSAIVVPEGIIFDASAKAFKILRGMLLDEGLIGIISLPANIFKPYSGVTTSILIIDKSIRREDIFYGVVKNDGFSLNDKRTPIDKNDLPEMLVNIKTYYDNSNPSINDNFFQIKKSKIYEEENYSFDIRKYIRNEKKPYKISHGKLGDLISLEYGKPLKESNRVLGPYPVFGSNGEIGKHNEFLVEGPFIIVGRKGSAGKVTYSPFSGFPIDTSFYVKQKSKETNLRFIFYCLKNLDLENLNNQAGVPGLNRNDAYELNIPVPPSDIQRTIVEELDKYQDVIDGCTQVVENYSPHIDINPEWETVELGSLVELINGATFKSSEWVSSSDDGLPIIRIQNLNNRSNKDFNYYKGKFKDSILIEDGQLLFSWSGSKNTSFGPHIWRGSKGLLNQHIYKVINKNYQECTDLYLFYILKTLTTQIVSKTQGGVGLVHVTKGTLQETKVPLPSITVQNEIVNKFEEERKVIEGNKKLIEIYTQKIQNRINKVWGE